MKRATGVIGGLKICVRAKRQKAKASADRGTGAVLRPARRGFWHVSYGLMVYGPFNFCPTDLATDNIFYMA